MYNVVSSSSIRKPNQYLFNKLVYVSKEEESRYEITTVFQGDGESTVWGHMS